MEAPAAANLGAVGRIRRLAILAVLGVSVLVTAIFAAVGPSAATSPPPPAIPRHDPARTLAPQADGDEAADIVAQWQKFVLNALLEPLLSEDEPPRWKTFDDMTPCAEHSSVTLDGKPLPQGDELPRRAFVVSWHLVGCMPLGSFWLMLDGNVDFLVQSETTGLQARVSSGDLRIGNGAIRVVALRPFEATLRVGPGHRE